MTSRRGRAILVPFLCFTAFGGLKAQETPYVEKVEVNVRTVLVRITDRNGHAPTPPPGPEELEVLEDGGPMKVLGVDPARPAAPPTLPAPAPGEPAPSAAPEPVSGGIPQHLYVDTALLEPGSIQRLVSALDRSLDTVLANGPLEIVVADPQPRQTLQATRDAKTVHQALQALGRSVFGKQSLILLRRQTLDYMRNSPCPNLEMMTRIAADQELRIIQDSFDRLLLWAVTLGGQRPDVVYFASDGFDSSVVDTYTRVIRQLGGGAPSLCRAGRDPNQMTVDLQLEFASKGGELVGLTARSLAALGVQAVPLALGGNLIDFGADASTPGQTGFNSRAGAIPLFAEPLSALRTLAETTGGEVVTSIGSLPAVFDAYDSSFVVSFRSEHPPDGKIHGLQVKIRRQGLSVRSAQFMTEASPEFVARGLTVRALREPPAETGLRVGLSIDRVVRNGKQYTGVLHVDTDLATLVSTLEQLEGGRMRVTIAVEVEGAREPFTTNQEFDVPRDEADWGADIPIGWPLKGRRIAVTVEELKTGTRGTGAADLPK